MAEDRLAEFILREYFEYWRQEREIQLEGLWRLAYDAFRGVYSSENLARWKALEGHEWRSKVFVRLTKQKVVAAVSQIEDIEFQGGKLPWSIEPTPYSESSPGTMLPPDVASARCEAMKRRLDDNLTESQAENAFLSGLLEQGVYGLSWLKCPVVRPFGNVVVSLESPLQGMDLPPEVIAQYGQHTLRAVTRHIPTVEHVNLWNVFWDLEHSDPQKSAGIIHREMMSVGRLLELADNPAYDAAAVREVAARYAKKDDTRGADTSEGPYVERLNRRRRLIPVYEFYGRVPRSELQNRADYDASKDGREVEIVCVIAGESPVTVIKRPKRNWYPGGVRPLHLSRWEEIPGEPGGVGIAENLQDSQAMINSAVRCFLDNKALASNLLIFGKSNALAPGQSKALYPGKFFELANHVVNWQEAMGFAQIPDVSTGLLEVINLFERYADKESNIPEALAGENAKFNPKTAFAFGQLMEAANKAMGKVIRNRERQHYLPVIKSLYWWEMATNPDESIKGDYTCKATGYTTYANRIQRGQKLMALLTMAITSPLLVAMINPYEHMREIYKGSDLDPDVLLKTPEEIEMQAQQMLTQISAPPGAVPPGGGAGPESMGAPSMGGMMP